MSISLIRGQYSEQNKMFDDLSGVHDETGTHNYGLASQVETGHLTDSFESEYLAEVLRWGGSSGLLGVRQYATNPAFDAISRRTHSAFSAMNLHDHSNYESMTGLGELAMIVNGYYYRSRHNDYLIRKSVPATAGVYGSVALQAPPIPYAVTIKPTGITGASVDTTADTQAKYFKNQWTDNPESIDVQLAYAEIWFEEDDGSGIRSDEGASERHADAIAEIRESLEQGTTFNARGEKDRLENLLFSVSKKYNLAATGQAAVSNMQFRIMCAKVGTFADVGAFIQAPVITVSNTNHGHVLTAQMTDSEAAQLKSGGISVKTLTSTDNGHTHNYEITWNGTKFVGVDTNVTHQHTVLIETGFSGAIPYDKTKAVDGIIDSTNVFSLVRDRALMDSMAGVSTFSGLNDSVFARYAVENLDRMCERCPGLDGEGSFIHEERTVGETVETFNDRDGGELNSAYYHRRFSAGANDAAGRNVSDRFFNDSTCFVAMNTKSKCVNKVSYMLPLEILLRSSIEHWNPYAIASAEPSVIQAEGSVGSEADPYESYSTVSYNFKIPHGFYTGAGTPDPADTGGTVWMRSGVDGVSRRVWSSGIRPFTHDNSQRTRFPVFQAYWDFNPISAQLQAEKKANDIVIADLTARIEALEV